MMNIEIMESFTDYSALTGGACPMSSHWIVAGLSTANQQIGDSVIEPGNRCLKIKTTGTSFDTDSTRMFAAPVDKVTIGIGFAYIAVPYDDNLPNGIPNFQVVDGSGNIQFGFYLNAIGKLVICGEGAAILATSYTNLNLSTIHRLCLTAHSLGANSVAITCSINGYEDPGLTITGDFQDSTAGASVLGGFKFHASRTFGGGDNTGDIEIYDIIVGTGECVDWGPVEVIEGPPNTDVAVAWIRSTGANNYANVDDAQANGDTDYNSTETLNAKDIFGFTDPEVPEKIIALGMVSWEKKEDSAARRYRHVLRVGGVDYVGADIYSTESYSRHITAWLQNPATVADWAPTDLAPLEFGYEYLGI